MSIPLLFLLYGLSAAALVFFSIKCADYVDLLDKKTNISGAFIGGVILAAVTSLPELVTSISSIFIVKNPTLILGNVLGSNVFNLCIFGGTTILAVRGFTKCKVGKAHVATILCTLAAYLMLGVVFWLGTGETALGQIPVVNLNIASLLILVVYFISFRFLSNDDSTNDEEDDSPLTVKQIAVRFCIMAFGLVGMSVIVTALTDELQAQLHLDASLAGAIFLGVATSLPELSSSITLVRHHNYNAMVGNVVGSNMFNLTIFSIADIFSGQNIYPGPATITAPTKNMLILGAISSLVVMGTILVQSRIKNKPYGQKISTKALYMLSGVLVIGCYLVSLILTEPIF